MMKSHVQGIPCQINVTLFQAAEPDPSCTDSDWDYYGGAEVEFEVFDRNGYKAGWLKDKLTEADIDRIEKEVVASAKANH